MERIREGKAVILVPQLREVVSSDMPVFYNPLMRVNRDLSVLGLAYLQEGEGRSLMVADPMSASGIRAVRFIKETNFEGRVFANDISEKAVEIIKENLALNGISEDLCEVSRESANDFLRKSRGFGFDYIDLDPFGTPVPFVESCALSMKRGGILSLTATDTAPLSGTYPQTCRRRYGSIPLRNEFKHEIGVRILIKKVIEIGAQHDIALQPLFAYSHLHYFKVFFRKDRGARATERLLDLIGYLLYCFGCGYRSSILELFGISKECPYCGRELRIAGPMWLGKLWDSEFTEFLRNRAQEREEISPDTKKIINLIYEECRVDTVGFYMVSKLCERLSLPLQPPIRVAGEFLGGVRTHFAGDGLRIPLEHGEVLRRAERLKDIMEKRREGHGT